MIPRRQVLGGALAGGVLGSLAAPELEAAAQGADRVDVLPIVRALEDLRSEVRTQWEFADIASIREAQITYLRGNGKLPDYIEVGAGLWFAAYDWHVRWHQPITLGRDPGGRATLLLLATQLVLRHDAQGNFMSLPYDQRG